MKPDSSEHLHFIQQHREGMQDAIQKLRSSVDLIRAKMDELSSQISQIETARVPPEVARVQFEAHVDKMAAAANFNYKVQTFWSPTPSSIFELFGYTPKEDGRENQIDAALCFLFKDQIMAKFDESQPDDYDSLPLEDRRGKIRYLERQIYELEVTEEELITSAASQGVNIARRLAARPEIVLEWKD